MRLHMTAVLLFLVTASASSFAQSSATYSEVVEVSITNVDVVVTGKGGRPVSGLQLGDFELYEDGVRKEITNFLEIGTPASAPATLQAATPEAPAPERDTQDIRRRNLVVFVDNTSIDPFGRKAIFEHLRQFLKENMRPGDEVALITWANTLKAELEPTSDLSTLDSVLTRMSLHTTLVNEQASDRKILEQRIRDLQVTYNTQGQLPPFREAIAEATLYGFKVQELAKGRVLALKTVVSSMRGAPGRKLLVFLTQNFSTNPAEDAFAWLDSVRDEFSGQEIALNEARNFELHDLIREVSKEANQADVTLYPIDVAGKQSGWRVSDPTENTRIATSNALVTQTSQQTMLGIAAETGGFALTGSSNWQRAFQTIASDLNTYYSIGYRSNGAKKDRLKTIEVRLRSDLPYAVRTRNAVMESSPSAEMDEAVAAYLFREVAWNDLSVRASVGKSSTDGRFSVVPLTIRIPTEKLTLLPDGSDLTGNFSVFTAFLSKDGIVSKVVEQAQRFRFPADSLKRRREITVKLDVRAVNARIGGVSVGVLDQVSQATGFAALKVGE